jgi:ATP-dependent exoDNAse (exonuclease V) beta subunit
VLYVAVTRARHALHMIVAPSAANEQSLYKTFGGLLRASLTDGCRLAPEQIAYETGDREWFRRPGVEHTPSAAEVAVQADSLAPLELRLAAQGERRRRGLQRVSPSGLEGGTHVRLADAWSEGSGDRTAALAYGTLIHAWFEQVKWLDDGPPSDDRLREVATAIPELALPSADIDRLLADFRAMLARPPIAAGLQRSAYHSFAATLTVETERPIAVRDDNRLLVGNIDRLVTIRRDNHPIAAEIIDFKTDAAAPDDTVAVASKVDFYRPQLSAYRSAVCAILGFEASQVSAKLLFVRAGIVEVV